MSIIGSISLTATDVGAFTNSLDSLMVLADSVADHGGRYLVKGGSIESVQGEPPPDRLLLLEFAHIGQARAWMRSLAFAQLVELASTCSRMQTVFMEGV
ncbi:MAG: DUF1330 domain-containing protein [Acidimicrobiia bacterium]|nr:DUF1330 domain-containing protein [Acidimicrobiia bacterium]MYC58222.1 DUF1330 domain-containing protein [Acidimicrobiia bacterium]MYG93634.1 DUF1330 domain-containing protein [Acidimicrobiia bacterium]MYI30307.1 DUF1330 domain-containing protein [Acidimicrobiia bacterium]